MQKARFLKYKQRFAAERKIKGNYSWYYLKYSVVVVIYCLRYLSFSLVRLLSQLNYAKTPKPQIVLEITTI